MRCNTFLGITALLAGAACSGSDSPTELTSDFATLSVSAADAFVYVDFSGATAQPVVVSDPAQANNWDIGFHATNVVLNGGTHGPGNVTAYCICQNASASADQVMAFSMTSEVSDFESISAAQAPANPAVWQNTAFDTSKWYRYNLTGSDHQVWPTFDVYLLKSGQDLYKLQIINYYGPGGEPRQISFRYALLTP